MFQVKKILITGASGFVGRHLVSFFKEKGYPIYALVRKKHTDIAAPQICGDLLDPRSIQQALKGITHVIHTASIINSNNPLIEKVNVAGTKTLVELSTKGGVGKIIYLSTENVAFDIPNLYTKTKQKAEEIIRSFPNYAIVRPSLIYGEGERLYFDKLIHIIKTWPIIPILGNGKNLFQPVFISDLLICLSQILEKDLKGIFTIAGGAPLSYEELINSLMKHLNVRKKKFFIPLKILIPFLALYEKIHPKPLMDRNRLKNFSMDKIHDVSTAQKLFNAKFLQFSEGLPKFLKARQG